MLLNLNYFNTNSFVTPQSIPIPSEHFDITLYGGGTFDDLWGENYIRTPIQVSQLDIYTEPEFTPQTFILAHFNNNLQAGNIISLVDPIDNWLIRRRGKNESKFSVIAQVDADVKEYEDRTVRSKENYTYQFIPVANNTLGAPLEADPVETDFRSVILIDPITGEGYNLCLNLQSDSITVNEDVVMSNTKGKYNTVLKGNRRYKSGNIDVIAVSDSSDDGSVKQELEFLNQFEDFIQGENEKIIKFPNGITCRSSTSSMTYSKLNGLDNRGNTIYSIGFSWMEVGDL